MPNTSIPLALVLRICALEAGPDTRLSPLSIRQTMRSGPFNPGYAAHWRAGSPPDPVLRLNRFSHIGVQPGHNYWNASAQQAALKTGAGRRQRQRGERPEFNPEVPPQGGFHAGELFDVNMDWLISQIRTVKVHRDWRVAQRAAKLNPIAAFQTTGVAYSLCEDAVDDQCVVWLPYGGDSRARPAPPERTGLPGAVPDTVCTAVAVVINNSAEEADAIIDVPQSLHLTGDSPAAAAATHAVVSRILAWLDVQFGGAGEDEEFDNRREASKTARGWNAQTLAEAGRGNQWTAWHLDKVHDKDAPRPRPGRPPLSEAEKARRAAERAEALQQQGSQPRQSAKALQGALDALQPELTTLRTLRAQVLATIDALRTLPDSDVLTPTQMADALAQWLAQPVQPVQGADRA